MKILLALFLGIVIGVAAFWFYSSKDGKSTIRTTGEQIDTATKPARDAIQETVRDLDLRPETIKDELARTGQVVRRKARDAGQAIADATADSRITAAIKTKLITDRSVPGMSISVNTTAGVVTLSGSVSSAEEVARAMQIAMDVEGVREVVSTLQVKARTGQK